MARPLRDCLIPIERTNKPDHGSGAISSMISSDIENSREHDVQEVGEIPPQKRPQRKVKTPNFKTEENRNDETEYDDQYDKDDEDFELTRSKDGTSKPRASRRSVSRRQTEDNPGSKKRELQSTNTRASKKPKTKGALQKEGVEARKELKASKTREQELETKIRDLEAQLARYGSRTLTTIREQQALRMDDQDIRKTVDSVISSWRPWAKEYCRKGSLEDLLRDQEEIDLFITSTGEFGVDMSGVEKMIAHPSSCYIALHTMLAHFICNRIFQQPFFFLDGILKGDSRKGVEDTYQALMDINLKNAKTWRAQTFLAFQDIYRKGANGKFTMDKAGQNRDKKLLNLSVEFLRGPASTLLRDLDDGDLSERQRELTSILKQVGWLYVHLQSQQQISLQIWTYEKLRPKAVLHSHDLLEPHRRMIADEDDVLHNCQFDLIVEPAIVAFNVEEDEGLADPTVWKKGIFWTTSTVELEPKVAAEHHVEEPPQYSAETNYPSEQSADSMEPEQSPTSPQRETGILQTSRKQMIDDSRVLEDKTGGIGNIDTPIIVVVVDDNDQGDTNDDLSSATTDSTEGSQNDPGTVRMAQHPRSSALTQDTKHGGADQMKDLAKTTDMKMMERFSSDSRPKSSVQARAVSGQASLKKHTMELRHSTVGRSNASSNKSIKGTHGDQERNLQRGNISGVLQSIEDSQSQLVMPILGHHDEAQNE